MFSGIGGFEIGLQRASNKQFTQVEQDGQGRNRNTNEVEHDVLPTSRTTPLCVGYSEIDKYAIKVYERHFNGHRNFGDATRIEPKQLPDFDLLVGGFPCQAFSIAGKRGGFADPRGTLFFDILRILGNKRPRHFILENVKGLLSHDGGQTFKNILGLLAHIGYRVEWQIFNSKDFGVPQNRERIIFIGHLRDECARQVLPITRNNSKNLEELTHKVADAFRVYSKDGVARTLKGESGGTGGKTGLYDIEKTNQHCETCICEKTDDIYNTDPESTDDHCETCQCNKKPIISKTVRSGGRNSPHGSKQNWDSYELNGQIRRLTPVECERLQGFPDNWTALDQDGQPISDTQRYKMCGNAVTVNVIEAVMGSLMKCV